MLINFLPHKFCCLVAQLCLPLWIPWTVAHQTSLSFTISRSLFKLMSIMTSNYLLLCCPLLHLTSIFLRKPIIFTHLCQIFWYIGWDVSREQHRNMYTIKGETDHQLRLDAWESARTWCSGRTWRERVGREVGGGIGMGKTCEPKALSFQCMTKFTTKKKVSFVSVIFPGKSGPSFKVCSPTTIE